jgi:hypothetical protein
MATSKALRAELEVAELEDELVKAKGKKGLDPDKKEHRELKRKLREARQAFREARQAGEPSNGEARPGAIRGSASTKGAGN